VVIPGGLYRDHAIMGSSKIGVYSTNVAAADGRVFAHTTGGWTFALIAESGEVLWSSPEAGGIHRAVIGGVLVSSSPDLVALDVQTGRQRWRIEDASSSTAMPVGWKHGGKEYVIVGNAAGQIRCIDPADGTVLWMIADSGINSATLTVSENHLLANLQAEEKEPARLGCYRISPSGFEEAWDAGNEYPWKPNSHPPVIFGRYVTHKTTIGGKDSRGDDLVVFDLNSGRVLHQISSNADGSNGQTYSMGGRLISQADASHSATPLLLYDAEDLPKLRQLGDVWATWHRATSAYSPMFMTHALADGRIIIRGARGLFCYDLRKR
jgi:outer membrane protein assembly factor BamB